jgi:hypothetical protein
MKREGIPWKMIIKRAPNEWEVRTLLDVEDSQRDQPNSVSKTTAGQIHHSLEMPYRIHGSDQMAKELGATILKQANAMGRIVITINV